MLRHLLFLSTAFAQGPFPLQGILYDVPIALLTSQGCTPCTAGGLPITYGSPSTPAQISACTGPYLFVAARRSTAYTCFSLGAIDTVATVTTPTTANVPRLSNGVFWYSTAGSSMGFSGSPTITQSSCDTAATLADTRLCWHYTGVGGYRAGQCTGLNSNANWQKEVYNCPAVPSAVALFNGTTALTCAAPLTCPCLPGYANNGTCTACSAGSFLSTFTYPNSICSQCPAGRYSAATAATSSATCVACGCPSACLAGSTANVATCPSPSATPSFGASASPFPPCAVGMSATTAYGAAAAGSRATYCLVNPYLNNMSLISSHTAPAGHQLVVTIAAWSTEAGQDFGTFYAAPSTAAPAFGASCVVSGGTPLFAPVSGASAVAVGTAYTSSYGAGLGLCFYSSAAGVSSGISYQLTTSPCPAGLFCAADAAAGTPCPAGHACPAGSSSWSPLNCGRGHYCPAGTGAPLPCPALAPPPPYPSWAAHPLGTQGPAFLVDTAASLNHCFWNTTSGDGKLSQR